MEPNEYQKLAARTECDQNTAACKAWDNQLLSTRLNHAVLGLAGEVGELAGAVERWIHYGQDLDEVNVVEELGDALWYLALACSATNVSLEDVMIKNIAKLRTRYPNKYSDRCASEYNRDRDAERKVLESSGSSNDILPPEGNNYHRICNDVLPPEGNNYHRICNNCKLVRVHDCNKSGLCPDCAADERAKVTAIERV